MSELTRFHEAQDGVFDTALAELQQGQKRTHWMWFIFPQLAALGRSSRARYYGLSDLDEARAYLADPVLGLRLRQVCQALLSHPDKSAEQIMGRIDALKLCSCATLFLAAGGGEVFRLVLEQFFGGKGCVLTHEAISAP